MTTTGKFIRLDVSALQQILEQDIDKIGDYYQQGFQVILNDVLGFEDGVISGLVATEDDNAVYIAADGRLIQDGIVGTSLSWSQVVVKPASGSRTDILVGQVALAVEKEVPRTFLTSPDSGSLLTKDTFIEEVQRVNFQVVEGDTATPTTPPATPTGWVLLAKIEVTTSTLTLDTSVIDYSNAVETKDFLADIEAWLLAQGYLKNLNIFVDSAAVGSDLDSINLIGGDNISLTAIEEPSGRAKITIDGSASGTISTVTGTFGTVTNTDTLRLVAGTSMTSIVVTNDSGDAVITFNASGGASGGGFLEYDREYQIGSNGVHDTGPPEVWRFTLLEITYVPGDDKLVVFWGGNLLRKGIDYTEITGSIVDLLNDPGTSNTVTFVHYGDVGSSALTGIDVAGTVGSATAATSLTFTGGGGIESVSVSESPADNANILINIKPELYNGSNADLLHTHTGMGETRVATFPRTLILGHATHNIIPSSITGSKKLQILKIFSWIGLEMNTYTYFQEFRLEYTDGTHITYLSTLGYSDYIKKQGGWSPIMNRTAGFHSTPPGDLQINDPAKKTDLSLTGYTIEGIPYVLPDESLFYFSLGDAVYPVPANMYNPDFDNYSVMSSFDVPGFGLQVTNHLNDSAYLTMKVFYTLLD